VRTAITLEPFAQSHLGLLSVWLRRPQVARWYPEPEENVAWAASPPQGGSHALIACEARPVGYIRWQVVDRETLDSVGLYEIPANAVDIDLLLGEAEYLGKGLGPAGLEELVVRLRANPEIPLAGLTSSVDNANAHRAFEKAGFHIARQYSPPGFGLCHLFTLALRHE
jgi:RimJ/RimL family protein N-acetyltransferase